MYITIIYHVKGTSIGHFSKIHINCDWTLFRPDFALNLDSFLLYNNSLVFIFTMLSNCDLHFNNSSLFFTNNVNENIRHRTRYAQM